MPLEQAVLTCWSASTTISSPGWRGFYQNSVAFLGVACGIHHRNPQVRLSKTWIAGNAQVATAVAGVRPVQRDSAVPDLQGGLKLAWNGWRGAGAQGFGRPELRPLAIGVSGLARRFWWSPSS